MKDLKIEYSQTLIFNVETFEILGYLKSSDALTIISFVNEKEAPTFYDTCRSWDIFGTTLLLRVDENGKTVIWYYGAPKGVQSYSFIMFMDLVVCFLNGKFKPKET